MYNSSHKVQGNYYHIDLIRILFKCSFERVRDYIPREIFQRAHSRLTASTKARPAGYLSRLDLVMPGDALFAFLKALDTQHITWKISYIEVACDTLMSDYGTASALLRSLSTLIDMPKARYFRIVSGRRNKKIRQDCFDNITTYIGTRGYKQFVFYLRKSKKDERLVLHSEFRLNNPAIKRYTRNPLELLSSCFNGVLYNTLLNKRIRFKEKITYEEVDNITLRLSRRSNLTHKSRNRIDYASPLAARIIMSDLKTKGFDDIAHNFRFSYLRLWANEIISFQNNPSPGNPHRTAKTVLNLAKGIRKLLRRKATITM